MSFEAQRYATRVSKTALLSWAYHIRLTAMANSRQDTGIYDGDVYKFQGAISSEGKPHKVGVALLYMADTHCSLTKYRRYVTGTMGEDGPFVAPPEFSDELD
jgi:hypothetical protein